MIKSVASDDGLSTLRQLQLVTASLCMFLMNCNLLGPVGLRKKNLE